MTLDGAAGLVLRCGTGAHVQGLTVLQRPGIKEGKGWDDW